MYRAMNNRNNSSSLLIVLVAILFLCVDGKRNVHNYNDRLLEGLDLTAFGNYTATGGYVARPIAPFEGTNDITNPTYWAMDVTNKRLFINHTNNIHWMFPDRSYLLIPSIGLCFYRNYTFDHHIHHYRGARRTPSINVPGRGSYATYTGLISDHHICKCLKTAVSVEVNEQGALMNWLFIADFPSPVGTLTVANTLWLENIVKENPSEDTFNLDTRCLSPVDFETFFGCPVC